MTANFIDQKEQQRFEYHVDGAIAFANYQIKDGTLYIKYVEAPPILRGTGAAGKLMQNIVETAKNENYKIIPICGYAASWLKKHREYADLVE